MLYRRPAYDVCGAQPQRHAVLRATPSTALAELEQSGRWSKAGSHALTALNAVVLNGGVQRWVRQREIALEFAVKAA
jgi:hypothetical protein